MGSLLGQKTKSYFLVSLWASPGYTWERVLSEESLLAADK